jgi:hypothetical protein
MTTATGVGWGMMAMLLVVADIAAGGVGGAALFVALFSIPVWILGGLLIGVPVWLIAHHLGHRSRRAAMVAGALAVGIGHPVFWALLLPGAVASPEGLAILAVLALAGAVSGAGAGYALHQSFYA